RPVAAPAAAAAARVAAAAVQAAARAGDRQGCGGAAHGELGDVRPAVVNAVDVVGHGDHHHGGRDHHDEAGQQQHHLADPAVRLGALLAATRVPPVTAWYMPLPSLIPFSCVHPSVDRSALLDPTRPIWCRLFAPPSVYSFLFLDGSFPPFFFLLHLFRVYVCMYIKQQKMNRPWPVKWRACSSIPFRPVPSVQKISAGGGLSVKDFSFEK
uniref:Uncharacterized protein n=1 Tax=Aegilops tauschii subsp. strangulata TaxID=200361 RepID=A0A453LD57_AEGTS